MFDKDQLSKGEIRGIADSITANQAGTCGPSTLGYGAQKSSPVITLRDRLNRQIEYANAEQRKSRACNELFELLEKHPEVARILELIEETGR